PRPPRGTRRREYWSWARTAAGHERDPRVDRADGHREPWLGLHTDPRRLGEPQSRSLPRHDRHRPPRTRPGTCAESAEEDDVGRVPEGAVGGPGGGGFLTGDVWTSRGLTRFAVLFLIDLSTRRIHIAGIVPEPDSAWMTQIGRNLTDVGDGFLRGKRFLIHDRDPRFTQAFRETLAAADVQVVRLPARSPNLNAHAERFVRTIKESCLDRMILVGEASLRRAVREFADHYHHERNHQGLGNRLIVPLAEQ